MSPRMNQSGNFCFFRMKLWLLVALVLALLIPFATVSAQGASSVTSSDKICVVGSVISHDEKPLTDGWTILAKPIPAGSPVLTVRSDSSGNFRFEQGLDVGDWEFSIELKPDYEPVTADHFILTLAFGQSDCYQIRFKVKKLIPVTVIKVDDHYNRLPDWIIHAAPAPSNPFATSSEQTTNAEGTTIFKLTPGQWVLTERSPNGEPFTPIVPPNGLYDLNVTVPITVVFKNRVGTEAGCIEVTKLDVAQPISGTVFGLPGWTIKVFRADGSLATSGQTDIAGKVRFDHLPLGPYKVVEEPQVGWAPVTSTSFDVIVTTTDRCESVTFENKQVPPAFCIEGRKIDTNGKVGLPDWTITADPVATGGYKPADVTTNGAGVYRFTFPDNDYRIPGASYKVCEVLKSGWLPHTATCQTVTLPTQPGICIKVPDFENQQVGHAQTTGGANPTTPTTNPGGKSCRLSYVVRRHDTLFGIAARDRKSVV